MTLSVLMPVRDAARTLGVALRSILRSRGHGALDLPLDLEVVCVDHRSRDESATILRRFAARSPAVRIVDGAPAATLAQALELGRAACRAPLIARMDADDVMHPDRLAADVAHFAAAPARVGAVACRARVIPKHRARPGLRAYVAWQNACITADDHAREIWIEQPVLHPATTFRADVLARLGGWRDVDGPEDYDLFLRMAVARIDVEKRSAVHHSWRQHDETSSRFSRDTLALLKARALCDRFALHDGTRDVVIAGAGKEGARMARALAKHGVRPSAFLDVAAKRIGRMRHGVPVLDARELSALRTSARAGTRASCFVLAAVGTSGARGVVRTQLASAGFTELEDCVVVA